MDLSGLNLRVLVPYLPALGWGALRTVEISALAIKSGLPMSALGHKRTKRHLGAMSALPPKADKAQTCWHVRLVPKADLRTAANYLRVTRSPRRR